MRSPGLESIGRWYGLSFELNPPAIILAVREDYFEEGRLPPPEAEIVARYMDDLGLTAFAWNEKVMGFDGALKGVGAANGFLRFFARVPRVVAPGGERRYTFEGANAIAASLDLFFWGAQLPHGEEIPGPPQLLMIQQVHPEVMGTYGEEIVQWARMQTPGEEIRAITKSMRAAYRAMSPGVEDPGAQAYVNKDGRLHLHAAGAGLNAIDLTCDHMGFCGNNGETSMQQITFLAGLAGLHETVDRWCEEQKK